MAPIDPPAAVGAPARVNVQAPMDSLDRDLRLVLRVDLVAFHLPAALTAIWTGHVDDLVDVLGGRSVCAHSVLAAGLTASALRVGLGSSLGKRSGLALGGPLRFAETL